MSAITLREWLEKGGTEGLSQLQLEEFPITGRGVKALRSFKPNDIILSVPGSFFWTVDAALDDPILGPVLRSVESPLSKEDTLAMFLLFVKSREEGYEGRRSHINLLPTNYQNSIFFTEEELEICSGSSLYFVTTQLIQQIREDYARLLDNLILRYPELFPLEKFTLNDVS